MCTEQRKICCAFAVNSKRWRHRLSTIKLADRIVMLDKGCIIEEGTYDELVAAGGEFAELVRRQQLEGA